jgi:hypothetical protein
MRHAAVALMLIAGCAPPPPPPHNPAVDRPVWGTPDPRYIPPPTAADIARSGQRAEAAARRVEYCESFAHSAWLRTSDLPELLASRVVGSSRYRAYFEDCMDSFRRVDRLIGTR